MIGFRIIESDRLVVGPFEDWSQVRSPARARRRRRKHRQQIRFYYEPDPRLYALPGNLLAGHPATVQKLAARIELSARKPESFW